MQNSINSNRKKYLIIKSNLRIYTFIHLFSVIMQYMSKSGVIQIHAQKHFHSRALTFLMKNAFYFILKANFIHNFSSKIMQKMRQEYQFHTSFRFLKKLYMRQQQVVCSLVLIYFDRRLNLVYHKHKLYKILDY